MKRFISCLLVATAVLMTAASCEDEKPNVDITPIMDKALNQSSSIWYADFGSFPQKYDRSQLPIGVFDSGTGGLTVLEVILAADYLDNIDSSILQTRPICLMALILLRARRTI